MKKMALILVFILAVLPLSAFAAEPYDFLHISGCDSWVSLRAEPSRDADRIARVPLGALVTYISDANEEFLEIQYAGMRGYILRSYLSEGYFFDMYNVPMYVRPETAAVYPSASTQTEPVAELKKGDRVNCVSKIGGDDATMAYVRFGETEGYMLLTDMTFFRNLDAPVITGAVMLTPGAEARLVAQQEQDDFNMMEIAAMLDRAEPGITCQGPIGAQLILHIDEGDGEIRYLRFMLPLDGCPILIAENLITYRLTEADGKRLWEIFDEAWKDCYVN